ncbi:hypothetical protein DWB85_10260 [Seongchinamella sediminis]|uniref:Uncharacterized protein n=1 Tax=Seongchinamella sediminis TaxID=2283635 RepID=A0A3L7E1F0_9GAMM|nr:hypothetical protein [Seongchinamella sediminis]RLQ21962.1 hypothetical protein DWB85_10260 [Seongchinamella sediminis]
MISKTMLAALIAALGFWSGLANAAVTFSQNGDEVTMEVVNETYTLTADQSQNILYVAYLDVFLPGGGSVSDGSRISGSATMSVNGGPAVNLDWWNGWQYRPGFQSPWTPEDVSFLFALPVGTLSTGDVITINGTLTMDAATDADIILPEVTPVTTVIGGHSTLYSEVTAVGSGPAAPPTPAVPVPTVPLTALWILVGVMGLLGARRLRKAV